MNIGQRMRAFWGCVSITFNQLVHLGDAPYPLSLSETCYLRRKYRRYRIGMKVVDFLFRLFGEYDHCEKSWYIGCSKRARYIGDPLRY